MSQINANFQEIISNNSNNNQSNALDNVTGTTILTSETLQGFSMANQFAICANSGNGPVLLSCLTPMLLPTLTGTSKGNFELTGGDGRGQNQPQTVQIQLASPFNLAGNLCNTNNAQSLPSLGLSYINLSSLTNAGGAFPLQITLNNPSNNNGSHQITIPASALNNLNQEVQMAQNYQISNQVKFEPECNVSVGQQMQQSHHHQQQQQQQQTIVSRSADISDIDDKVKRKPRRRIPNKSNRSLVMTSETNNNNVSSNQQSTAVNNSDERLLDHKGRPFIYNCPHCPKKFTLNSRLTAHLRCHTGIRPYTCIQCGFSFTQKSYLIRHAAVHTEERPFTCERCLKTYKHYGSLANHRKLHRKEDKNGGGCTSEISDSDQKQVQSCVGENNNAVSITNAGTATAIISSNDQSNFDTILQLHSDWSNNNNGNNGSNVATTAYLITNTTASNNIAYYDTATDTLTTSVAMASSASSNHLTGTGPVAFPDQQLTDTSLASQQGFCISNSSSNTPRDKSNQSAVFIDHHLHHQQQQQHHHPHLQLIPSSSSSSSNQNIGIDNNNILYTRVELSIDALSQAQSSQQQHTYTTTFSTTNTV